MGMLSFGLVATTFTSCKDYDDDIDNLQQQINTVVNDLNELKDKVNEGVSSVTFDETTGKLTVVAGKNSNTYTIQSGSTTTMPEIKLEGNKLYVGSEVKGTVEAGDKVTVNADGILCVNEKPTDVKIGRSYMIKDEKAGTVTISMLNDKDVVETVVLPIYNAASAITEMEFLGFCKDIKDATTEKQLIDDDVFGFDYGQVTTVPKAEDWAGASVEKDQILTNLEGKSILVRVAPANANVAAVKEWAIENTALAAAPIEIGTPVRFEGVLTKSASQENGYWLLPISEKKYVGKATNYTEIFTPVTGHNALFALSADGFKSSYSITFAPAKCKDDEKIKFEVNQKVTLGKKETAKLSGACIYDSYLYLDELTKETWDIEIDPNDPMSFTVVKSPDKVTIPTFPLYCKYMTLDGTVHYAAVAGVTDASKGTAISLENTLAAEVELAGEYIVKQTPDNVVKVDIAPMIAKLKEANNLNLWYDQVKANAFTGFENADKESAVSELKYLDKDGKATTDLKAVTSLQFTIDNSKIKKDATYTGTVSFKNGTGADATILNTVKVNITVKMPAFSLEKEESKFIGNTLYAYMDDNAATSGDQVARYPLTKAFKSFDKWFKDGYGLTFTATDKDTKIEFDSNNGTKDVNVQLKKNGKIDGDEGYGKEYTVKATYQFGTNKDLSSTEEFKVIIYSPIAEGTIKPATGDAIVVSTTNVVEGVKISAKDFDARTYNKDVKYNIFKEWNGTAGAFVNPWLKSVEFKSTNTNLFKVETPVDPTAKVASYVVIRPENIATESAEADLEVTVTDIWGYVKTFPVKVRVTKK